MNVYDAYTDGEPICMDHPLFRARTQSRIDAGILFAQGLPLADAIRSTRERMQSLFGEVPLALIDASVTLTYMGLAADRYVDEGHQP